MARRGTVLLIDSDEDSRIIFGAGLGHLGYRVLQAPDAVEGLRLARAFSPDLIIREHPTPLPNGVTLAEALKADPATASIPIVTVTARVLEDQLRDARQDHSTLVLTKPIPPVDLAQHVESLLKPAG